ncbi:hypothetical protein ABID56_000511 [Alkalibacillus flavidus]|uniref:DUF2624 domain-containing protein n=1 Tax=Alkalibacillus flavidus TaxID=546021 RepID=A0ABV2KS91_9BACI
MFKELILNRLYQATPEEIVYYSHKYNIPLNEQEASALIRFIHQKKIDPFQEKGRLKTFQFIEQQFGPKTAQDTADLLKTLADQYGLNHLL